MDKAVVIVFHIMKVIKILYRLSVVEYRSQYALSLSRSLSLSLSLSLSVCLPLSLSVSLSYSLGISLPLRSPVSHPKCEVPFPPRRSGEYRKGMIPARPLYQGGCGSVWDPEPSKEQVGDWGGPATVWSLLCVAETRATRPNGEWGYSTRRQCWATSAQRRCHPEETLYLPTFSHLFDCQ
jgi:CCR4-NOT transcription complex subunit 10